MGVPISLPALFFDARGRIQNILELSENARPIRGVAIIESKAGSERSNHWHREDGHYLYVLAGEMHYQSRALAEAHYAGADIYRIGDCVFTGPRIWHRTFFPVDTVLLSLSFLPRDSASHESDVVR